MGKNELIGNISGLKSPVYFINATMVLGLLRQKLETKGV